MVVLMMVCKAQEKLQDFKESAARTGRLDGQQEKRQVVTKQRRMYIDEEEHVAEHMYLLIKTIIY